MTEDAKAIVKAIDRLGDEVRDLRIAVERAMGLAAEESAPLPAAEIGCPHPADQRVSMASPGNDDFHCRACGALVAQPLVAAEG